MLYTPPTGSAYRLYNDLLRQTHLLIAGATGSGKSTVVNGMITNALYHTPNKVGFILIDPKRVELREYADLPHVLRYTDNTEDVPATLRGVLDLVQLRLADMQKKRQRMYDGSDIYVIIDELMPIMVNDSVKKAVLPVLQEILAIARCSKIHCIVCTQSPITAVLPTILRCNFSSIIALKTINAQDSRNIIGRKGCEHFPDPATAGKAYAVYRHGCTEDLYSVPRYTDDERQRMIDYWTAYRPRRRA